MVKQMEATQKRIWDVKQEVEDLDIQVIKEDFRVDLREDSGNVSFTSVDYHGLND